MILSAVVWNIVRMNFICTAFSDVMFTGLLTKAWSMASWKSLVFKITCHIKTNNSVLDECTRTKFWERGETTVSLTVLGTAPASVGLEQSFVWVLTHVRARASWSSWAAARVLCPVDRSDDSSDAAARAAVPAPHTRMTGELERKRQTKRKRDQEGSLAQRQITCWLNSNLAYFIFRLLFSRSKTHCQVLAHLSLTRWQFQVSFIFECRYFLQFKSKLQCKQWW